VIRVLLWLCAAAALWVAVGCERTSPGAITAEIDEPAYRRGKELLRQGRNQEALASFFRVIEQRGDDAPESHLEVGLLYQNQIRDPIAAIYHFRKFVEAKPNAPQAELVRQRIAAAMREFASTLPGKPLENQAQRNDLLEVVERQQREIVELKEQLAIARSNAALAANSPRATVADLSIGASNPGSTSASTGSPADPLPTQATVANYSPITLMPMPEEPARSLQPPTRPGDAAAMLPNRTAPPATGPRRHIVAKGDTLYSLAQQYYENRSRWRDIYSANRTRMNGPDDLRIGMELIIP
jgi:nucleoid-associated protein YgaU